MIVHFAISLFEQAVIYFAKAKLREIFVGSND
jgi:hypothetical protein